MTLSVIIVTYNSAGCIESCLRSVRAQRDVESETLVIDNASVDGTVERVREAAPSVQLIANADNVGFGRANNQAVASSTGDLLYLLNPDARLMDSGALARLERAMESRPAWGLAGTRVLSEDGREAAAPETAYPDQHVAANDFHQLPGRIAWVIGASMIIRREAFQTVGGFDPGFFLHSEETDLCLRLRQAGFEIGYLPDVEVRHVGGASEEPSDSYSAWMRRMEGLHRFWTKHYSRADVLRLARRDLRRSGFRSALYSAACAVSAGNAALREKLRRNNAIRDASRRLLTARRETGD